MKIPRKEELLRLQELYKTDERIAEALGGIPEYLVAYWRRKKSIPRHSSVKFSRQQITELWERFGDDFRCGRELNISKGAFYSWRRKYGVTERPAVLKLEQLELRLDKEATPELAAHSPEPKTAFAKIWKRCRDAWPEADSPADWIIAARTDCSSAPLAVSPGPTRRAPSSDPAFNPAELIPHGAAEPLWCYPEHGSIVCQLVESRVILPGQLVRGPRALLGGLGGIGVLVVGENSHPETHRVIKIELTRRLPQNADVEDLFLALVAHGWHADWVGAIVEFWGGPIERLTVDRKVKLCELVVHRGAAAALCPFDDMTRRHFGRTILGRFPQTHADRTAVYDGEHFLESRHVDVQTGRYAGDGTITVQKPALDQAGGVIIGPAALPFEIERAAECVAQRVIGPDRPLLVCPATTHTFQLAHRRGWAQTIRDAGGSVLDVSLTRRLGPAGLLALASGREGRPVILTNPLSEVPPGNPEIILAGARAAIQYGLGLA